MNLQTMRARLWAPGRRIGVAPFGLYVVGMPSFIGTSQGFGDTVRSLWPAHASSLRSRDEPR